MIVTISRIRAKIDWAVVSHISFENWGHSTFKLKLLLLALYSDMLDGKFAIGFRTLIAQFLFRFYFQFSRPFSCFLFFSLLYQVRAILFCFTCVLHQPAVLLPLLLCFPLVWSFWKGQFQFGNLVRVFLIKSVFNQRNTIIEYCFFFFAFKFAARNCQCRRNRQALWTIPNLNH